MKLVPRTVELARSIAECIFGLVFLVRFWDAFSDPFQTFFWGPILESCVGCNFILFFWDANWIQIYGLVWATKLGYVFHSYCRKHFGIRNGDLFYSENFIPMSGSGLGRHSGTRFPIRFRNLFQGYEFCT